ncbi:ORF7b [Betacoronavirus sp. RsYN04]|nr:ORF7b [Betacoronavirus sp. RmYN05]QWN56228.1 ORF7b [Betacoronavirus sp. RmYN08]QWN56248.1 ORF7b [Betacoronavirus sp. RsYN04]
MIEFTILDQHLILLSLFLVIFLIVLVFIFCSLELKDLQDAQLNEHETSCFSSHTQCCIP